LHLALLALAVRQPRFYLFAFGELRLRLLSCISRF
jgi:hypothetical protein